MKAGFAAVPLFGGLNVGAGLAVDGGGRAGRESWSFDRPGGAGYDMMNVCLFINLGDSNVTYQALLMHQ